MNIIGLTYLIFVDPKAIMVPIHIILKGDGMFVK